MTNAINSSVMPEIVRVKRGSRIGIRMPNFLPSSGFRPPTWHLPCGRMDDKGRGRKGRRTAKKSVPIGRRRRRRPSSVLAQISNGMTDDPLSLSLSLSALEQEQAALQFAAPQLFLLIQTDVRSWQRRRQANRPTAARKPRPVSSQPSALPF